MYENDARVVNVRCWVHNMFGYIHSGRYRVYHYIKLFGYIHMGCNVKVVSVVLGTLNCLGISEVVGIGCHINIVIVWCWVH